MGLRGFIRAFRSGKGMTPAIKSPLVRAAKDALHMRGRGAGSSGGSAMYEIIGEAAENYEKSFKDEK